MTPTRNTICIAWLVLAITGRGTAQEPATPPVTGADAHAPTVVQLKEALATKGYTVSIEPDAFAVTVKATKDGKSAESYGLLGVKWDERSSVTLKYLKVDGKYRLVNTDSAVFKKAPLIGKWEKAPTAMAVVPTVPKQIEIVEQ